MAHFQTLVLVDPSEPNPAGKADEMMEQYFEPDMASATAKCDGYVIGGRYDGDIWGKQQNYNLSPAEFQERYGLDVIKYEDNIRPVSMIRAGFVTYAVITPDGIWQDCEDISHDEWIVQFNTLIEIHSDHIGVAIDCHC